MAAEVQSFDMPLPEDSQLSQATRYHHSGLQALTIMQIHASRQREMMSSYQNLSPSPITALSLGSPTFFAARQYFQENNPTVKEHTPVRRTTHAQIPVLDIQHLPRRHSTHSSLVRQSSRLRRVSLSSFSPLQQNPRSTSVSRNLAEESRLQLLSGVDQSELSRLGSIVTKPWPVQHGRLLPQKGRVLFEYKHNKLSSWGRAYLGNSATADAFVRARHLRRPTSIDTHPSKESSVSVSESPLVKKLIKEDDPMAILSEVAFQLSSLNTIEQPCATSPSPKPNVDPDVVTIRARVIPKSKERKPFLIQRQFDVKELRDNLPVPSKSTENQVRGSQEESERNRRSQSLSAQGRATANSNGRTKRGERGTQVPLGSSRTGIMPIHIEYALHHLPILAALMLSGHIRKGDSIDLPLPHPEVWDRVVAYVYTGEGEITGAMREDIEFLGGSCE